MLIWGDDQYENFKEDIVPPYCISAYERFKFASPPGNVWGETDKTYELAGHRAAAKMLATRLIEEGFDTAYAYKPLHHPWATPSPTRSCTSTTTARVSSIRSCRSRSTATAAACSPNAADCRCSNA